MSTLHHTDDDVEPLNGVTRDNASERLARALDNARVARARRMDEWAATWEAEARAIANRFGLAA